MHRLGLAFLLLAVAPGCDDSDDYDPDYPVGLDRVRDLGVSAEIVQPGGGEPRTLEVHVGGDAVCIAAGTEFAVTLAGATTTMLEPGARIQHSCGGGMYDPSAVLVLDEGAQVMPAILTVGDEYHTVELDLSDVLVPRAATLVAPADGVLHSGQSFEVVWAPTSGVRDRITASAHVRAVPGLYHDARAVADGDSRLTGTAPVFDADRDGAELGASLRGFRYKACEGARCTVGGRWSAGFPVDVRRD